MEKRCMGCMELYEEAQKTCPHCGYEEGTPAREAYHIVPGSMLSERYVIGRVLGFGGFGITYIGFDTVLLHRVAIKEYLPSEFSTRMPMQKTVTVYSGEREEQFLSGKDKFLDEARRLAQFNSEPGIVHIYDCFEENNTAYIVMEFLDGESLKDKLERDGKMTVEEAKPVILSVLTALKKVHQIDIIHRDIAPDNIYLTKDNCVKLLDFGAARYATTKHSKSLSVIIKPGYAPVEQYRSRGDQGPWTDIYAVAATFYKMLTNITPDDSMERAVKDRLKEPSKLGAAINKNVEAALLNALNVKIEGRTKSAEAFEQELLADDVKRVIVRTKRMDIGKWPLWSKLLIGAAGTGIAVFSVLLLTGVISFDIAKWGNAQIPEGQTRVPNVINDAVDLATKRVEEAQLKVQISDKQYSETIPEDRVLEQSVRGGTLAAVQDTVGIIISAGIKKTFVPNTIGLVKEEAAAQLLEAGLVAEYTEKEYRAAPGTVAEQSIEAETELDTGSSINITISSGIPGGDDSIEVTIPAVEGKDYDAASEELIQDFIYLVRRESEYSDVVPAGVIISQEPEAGTVLKQNSNVTVVVSAGKEMMRVPDTQYKTEDEARQLLEEVFLIADIQYEANDQVQTGNVIRQSLEAGSQAEKGTAVTVYVSTGQNQTGQNQNRQNQQNQPQNQTQSQGVQVPEQTEPPAQTQAQTQAPPVTEAAPPPETAPPETQAPAGVNEALKRSGIMNQ